MMSTLFTGCHDYLRQVISSSFIYSDDKLIAFKISLPNISTQLYCGSVIKPLTRYRSKSFVKRLNSDQAKRFFFQICKDGISDHHRYHLLNIQRQAVTFSCRWKAGNKDRMIMFTMMI